MKQIWHKKEREPRRGEDLDLVFKSTDGTYFVDTTMAPISLNFYYDDIKEWCYAEDLVEQIERLQEQLNEANKCIKIYAKWTNWLHWKPVGKNQWDYAKIYIKKWGVK